MQITAAVARAKNAPLSLEEVSLAEPRADEVLVRLVAAGICHTDISMRDHIIYPVPHPVVLGHEGAGIVERVGAGVTRLAAGDPVILTSASAVIAQAATQDFRSTAMNSTIEISPARASTGRARCRKAARSFIIIRDNPRSRRTP
jgi:NADPH:quinone reductase-like Zn-dependent oxidoreductase